MNKTLQPELIILGGLPASGKSHIAKKMTIEQPSKNYVIFNIDEYGPDIKNKRIWKSLWRDFSGAVKLRKNIIIDACNHNEREYIKYIKPARNYRIVLMLVHANLDTALERNKNRSRKVPENIILKRDRIKHPFLNGSRYEVIIVENTLEDSEE